MSEKLDEFKKYVDDSVSELKGTFDDMSNYSKEIAEDLKLSTAEVKQTILEKLKLFVDKELEEINKGK